MIGANLPGTGLQHRLRPGARSGIRSLDDSDEFARGFGRSERDRPLRPRISRRTALGGRARLRQALPGLGEGNLDTHHELPSINKSWKKLWAEDLVPYRDSAPRAALHDGCRTPTIPPSPATQRPASLSKKWITDVLRKKIGYRGLIVSDDLEMGGVLKAAPIEQAAVGHIRAGGDLCLICHIEEYVTRSYEELIQRSGDATASSRDG